MLKFDQKENKNLKTRNFTSLNEGKLKHDLLHIGMLYYVYFNNNTNDTMLVQKVSSENYEIDIKIKKVIQI